MSKKAKAHLSLDPMFSEIIETTRLKRRPSDSDVFATLVRTIIFQQLSGKAANTIHLRFLGLFNESNPHPAELVSLKQEQLRAAGLSGQKSGYVQNVAKYWISHRLDATRWENISDEDVIEILTEIKGVGTWTVQMLLMFTLNRPDVFPLTDLGIRNAIIKRYRLRSKGKRLDERLLQIAEPWRPYRTLACRYLWRWLHD